MNCPSCETGMRVLKTVPLKRLTLRSCLCPGCGTRCDTEERVARAISRPPPTHGQPTNRPPATQGQVAPPSESALALSVSDPLSSALRAVPDQTGARVEQKPSEFMRLRNEFVAAWEERYQDKYPFETKDAVALASMIRKHPQLVARWAEMVTRYFESEFWSGKRNPLVGLATNPVEFSGETNGYTRLPNNVRASRDALSRFVARGTK